MKIWKILILLLFIKNTTLFASDKDIACVADAVVHEAGAEPYDGQIAVAEVIKNRSIVSNQSPCDVVHEKHGGRYQFSFLEIKHRTHNIEQFKQASEIAKNVLSTVNISKNNQITNGSQFFHRCLHGGHNNGEFQFVKRIGNQCYFKDMNTNDKYADILLDSQDKNTGVPNLKQIDYPNNYTEISRVWGERTQLNNDKKIIVRERNIKKMENNISINFSSLKSKKKRNIKELFFSPFLHIPSNNDMMRKIKE